tara:strand:+ start:38 stop:652 length:615 start_codon:yes stop_codon:yes gene_type:complete
MIGILKIGHGNIRSLINILDRFGYDFQLVSSKNDFKKIDKLILPGVGSFYSSMKELEISNLIEPIQEFSLHQDILGICLGMQLMMKSGSEGGQSMGLSLVNGNVKILPRNHGRLPHIGWNEVYVKEKNSIMNNVENNSNVYFVHSYECIVDESENIKKIYSSFFKYEFLAGFQKGNIFGTQFHPEKSQRIGDVILKNFLEHPDA